MNTQARVASIEALERFRAALIVFVTKSRASLDAVRETVRRTQTWLQNECLAHWEGEIRRRGRLLDQAQQELYSAKLSKMTATVAIREAVVRRARTAVEEAAHKLRMTKQWIRNFDAAADPLMKKTENLRDYLDRDLTDAGDLLRRSVRILESYAERTPPAPSDSGLASGTQAQP